MEQARYWMWAKKKPDPNPRNHVPIGDSWEEQAFAEDAAAGALGGSVWPPRSYSCSFCRREFRSAQALGGHMNVHRRDRARLKSSPTDHSPEVIVPQDPAPPLLNTSCSFLYNPNPDFPEIRVSSPAAAKVIISSGHDNTTTLSFLPPENDVVLWEKLPSGWTSFVGGKRDRENEISVACRKKTMMTKSIDDEDDEVVSCKRRRIEGMKASSTLFPNKLSGAVDHRTCVARSQVLKLCPGPVEELDLELRLGHAPKVK